VIVTPDTVLRRFREHWAKLSGRPTVGRSPVNAEIIALVRKMAAATNPLWGAPRIHGELLKLGIEVAERTISRLIPKRPTPPSQDLAHVPHEPCPGPDLDRLLYRPHRCCRCSLSWSSSLTIGAESCTSTSPRILPLRGPLNRSWTLSPTTPRQPISCAIETPSTGTPSANA
jgi:hypothetical protein